MEWSLEEVTVLNRLAKQYPSRVYPKKDERWRLISKKMPGRSKRNCYMKYKQLRRGGAAIQPQPRPHPQAQPRRCSTPSDIPAKKTSVSRERISSLKAHHVDKSLRDGMKDIHLDQTAKLASTAVGTHDLAVTDIDDDDVFVETWDRKQRNETKSIRHNISLARKPRSIILEEAKALRSILFGNRRPNCFSDTWRRQGLCFSDLAGLKYGLVQHSGGPCGVLAVVQASFLKTLLFAKKRQLNADWSDIDGVQRDAVLVEALSEIIWRCRASDDSPAAVAVIGQSRSTSEYGCSRDYRPDGLTEKLQIYLADTVDEVMQILRQHLRFFTKKKGNGVVLLLYSCLLSRGVLPGGSSIRDDFDTGLGGSLCLIGKHNYASQEMVNLLLTGRAVSNVFDGEKLLQNEDGDGDDLKLHGLDKQSEIGFLTLFEHYECIRVGERFKSPTYPIWVVCSESHYSVLFSTNQDFVDDGNFDLYYYDELGMQEESIRLTIDPYPESIKESKYNSEDPPLECCIRTKWPGASIDWNGSDVIY